MTTEARPHDPAPALDEREDVRRRIWLVEDRLFMMVEFPNQTPLTIDLMFNRLEELAAGLDRFAYVVDLSGVKRPDARTRARLIERVRAVNSRLDHVGVVVGMNAVIRAVAKLVTFAVGFRSFSFHLTVDEALEACRRALR